MKSRVVVLGPDYRMPTQPCLGCGHAIEGGFEVGGPDTRGEPPREGTVILCAYCSHLQILDHIGKFREPTIDELNHILSDENVRLTLEARERGKNK